MPEPRLRWSRTSAFRMLEIGVAAGVALTVAVPDDAGRPRVHEPAGFELFESPQAEPLTLSPDGARLHVAVTTANAVEVYRPGSSPRCTTR